MMIRKNSFLAAALIGLGTAGVANAGSVLQFDVNSFTAVASGAFSTGFTGSVTMTKDANTNLNDILIDGASQNIATGQLAAFTGVINIVSGVVTSGAFSLTDVSGSSYETQIIGGSGVVGTAAGSSGPFTITGLTFNGLFTNLVNGTDFAGVDVSSWDIGGVSGSFLEFKFGPDANGVDTDADADIFAMVPMPSPVLMGVGGLAGVAGLRRRRA